MPSKKNTHLFKERITRTDYTTLATELGKAMDAGQEALKMLLLGTTEPDLYEKHGSYRDGQHNRCEGLKEDRFTEKRLCKCLYYRNSAYLRKCDSCDFKGRYDVIGEYRIADYEIPAYYYGDGIGEIDLVITDETNRYATEVKPYQGNEESLLRMIAEIMTYTLGYPTGKYKKAIAFFEGSPQEQEYNCIEPEIQALLHKADITVFRFEKANGTTYKICKL